MKSPPPMTDLEAIDALITRWHEVRDWAEALLCESLGLEQPRDVLNLSHPRIGSLRDGWTFRCHGIGVDIMRPGNRGGIDFDFGRPLDTLRLLFFLVKQLNGGALTKRIYRPLLQDQARFEAACHAWTEAHPDSPDLHPAPPHSPFW